MGGNKFYNNNNNKCKEERGRERTGTSRSGI
jgi:hypothetical protein